MKTLFENITTGDYHAANESFSDTMARKIAVRLGEERKHLTEDPMPSNVCQFCGGHENGHGKCVGCERPWAQAVYPQTVKESMGAINSEPLPLLTHKSVQAIFGAIGDVNETELLCGVTNLVVSGDNVVSFVGVGEL